MKLVFDFDHTLFDMMAMHEAIESAVRQLGVSPQQYRDAYTSVTNWKKFTVSALSQALAKSAKVKPADVVEALELVAAKSGQWLYPDVKDGLAKLKAAGHELYLLSWGDTEWQMKKINRCDILPLFREVLSIAQVKADYLKAWKKTEGEKVVLIDDKPAELKAVDDTGHGIGLIRMRRPGAKYSDQETPHGMAEAKNMDDVIRIVSNM